MKFFVMEKPVNSFIPGSIQLPKGTKVFSSVRKATDAVSLKQAEDTSADYVAYFCMDDAAKFVCGSYYLKGVTDLLNFDSAARDEFLAVMQETSVELVNERLEDDVPKTKKKPVKQKLHELNVESVKHIFSE